MNLRRKIRTIDQQQELEGRSRLDPGGWVPGLMREVKVESSAPEWRHC